MSHLNPSAIRFTEFPRNSLVQGIIAGWIATQTLDTIGTLIYENESDVTREEEDDARGNLHAYEVAVDRMTRRYGVPLQKKDLAVWGWRFHKVFGLLGGLMYVAMRRKTSKIGFGGGLAFGTAFFLIVDELLMPLLRLTPGPRAFSWKVHARGAIAHIAYGVAVENTLRVIEKATEKKVA